MFKKQITLIFFCNCLKQFDLFCKVVNKYNRNNTSNKIISRSSFFIEDRSNANEAAFYYHIPVKTNV